MIKIVFFMLFLLTLVCVNNCQLTSYNPAGQPAFGAPFDEVVVESSLVVRPKNSGRQSRTRQRSENIDASPRVALPPPLPARTKRHQAPIHLGSYVFEQSQGLGSSFT
ncbi:uncharacterized protein LOC113377423 [Ctenocephalides felis]|uniref:uncharacterized protein LOC113377423 n=1 Tax=Ctenocephalides felis TaxID=7515 RepID=UPI000E6E4167|nr:uncharacterized protein LOC113377423 [Ctenocephalides felis]